MYLVIRNAGEIEPGALSLMGASTKDASEHIGKFGSGFKYAIATLLREKVGLTIYSGTQEIKIETRPERFRDRDFEVIWFDGQKSSLTTSTGPEWTVRDAIREIWSNAIDEGVPEVYVVPEIPLLTGKTTVMIEYTEDVRRMWESWDMYFTHNAQCVEVNDEGKILAQPVTNFYRRGIWICEDRGVTGIFSYDFQDIKLPESRKISSHSAMYPVFRMLNVTKSEFVFQRILASRHHERAEWRALELYALYGDGRETLHSAFKKQWDYIGNLDVKDKVQKLAGTRRVYWCTGIIYHSLKQQGLEDILSAVDFNDTYEITPWPIGYEDRLRPVLARLKSVGVDMTKFPIKFAVFREDMNCIAMADMKRKLCLLTDRSFEADPRDLVKSLIEEWTHLEHNVLDNTPQQQHVYLNLITSLIERIK